MQRRADGSGGRALLPALAGLLAGLVVFALVDRPPLLTFFAVAALTVLVAAAVGVVLSRSLARPPANDGPPLDRATGSATSDQRAAEAERDRLAMLIDELGEGILIADRVGLVTDANPAFRRIFGVDPDGRRVVEVIRDHELLEAIDAARVGEESVAEIERNDPRRFLRAIVRRLENGELLVVVQDLTDMRRLETVRRDFVANISHELRTPISSLKAMAEVLEGGAVDDPTAARDFIERMHAEIEDLAQLVEELLALSRLEAAEFELHPRRVAAAELVARACERMGPLADRAGVMLTSELTDGGRDVDADPERIAQVFSNLIHNAVKYTPRGGRIRVATAVKDGMVAFSVRDTGQGIVPAELPRIFERFYKGDRARASTGAGLGLAIAKHIVHAHGGTISADSEGPGRGATFTFTLPT